MRAVFSEDLLVGAWGSGWIVVCGGMDWGRSAGTQGRIRSWGFEWKRLGFEDWLYHLLLVCL